MNIDLYNWDEIDKICNGLYVEKKDDDGIDYGSVIRYCKENKIDYDSLTEEFVENNFKKDKWKYGY